MAAVRTVRFTAYGHVNVIAEHRTTFEITTEEVLTPRGTCIIAVRATKALCDFDAATRRLVLSPDTRIRLSMTANGVSEVVWGWGGSGLSYQSPVSMVVRRSDFQCGRTLMIHADKAACDLDRQFVVELRNPETTIHCEVAFFKGS